MDFGGLFNARDGQVVWQPVERRHVIVRRSSGFASLGNRYICKFAQLSNEIEG